jgi:hypothetical protein
MIFSFGWLIQQVIYQVSNRGLAFPFPSILQKAEELEFFPLGLVEWFFGRMGA